MELYNSHPSENIFFRKWKWLQKFTNCQNAKQTGGHEVPYPNWYIFNTTSRPKVQVFLAEEGAEWLEEAEDLKVRCKSVSSKYKSGSYHTQAI